MQEVLGSDVNQAISIKALARARQITASVT